MQKNAKLRVLVVDDHRDTADALAWLLQGIGHDVRAAYDATSAIRAFDEFAPEVVFQDLLLPGKGGVEIARDLRRRGAPQRLLLVAMTGLSRADAPAAFAGDTFDLFLQKPVALTALTDALGSLVRVAPQTG
jgi:CheY-like chemotaxis protein